MPDYDFSMNLGGHLHQRVPFLLKSGHPPRPSPALYAIARLNRHAVPLQGEGVGEWRRLVAHLVWDQGVAGSNPVSPTI